MSDSPHERAKFILSQKIELTNRASEVIHWLASRENASVKDASKRFNVSLNRIYHILNINDRRAHREYIAKHSILNAGFQYEGQYHQRRCPVAKSQGYSK